MVDLKWLAEKPARHTGVTWGVPWEKGLLSRYDSLSLQETDGSEISLQSWPLAYWPDGSVKWTGHAAVMERESVERLELKKNKQVEHSEKVTTKESNRIIEIDTGLFQCVINKEGYTVIESIAIKNQVIAGKGQLVTIKEEQTESDDTTAITQKRLIGKINKAEIEQSGPVRAVIKIEGSYAIQNKGQGLFPFVIRLYFYANTAEIKMVHTFIYNGNPSVDFIKGAGIEFSAVITGEAWNRHISFAADEGMFSEAAQLLLTRRYGNADGLFNQQILGESVDLKGKDKLQKNVKDNAVWNDYKIIQDSADHYKILKRTEKGCSWVESLHGTRAKGLLYAGGKTGGIAVGMKDFWQKYPSSLEVNALAANHSKITVWFWSPDCQAMDFRHYSKDTHVLSAYEGFEEMRATPNGIANTSEISLSCFASPPRQESLFQLAEQIQDPPLLICSSEHYHNSGALGVWSLPDRSQPFKSFMEDQLDAAFSFYKNEIEQRKWYGYWNYGDVMHTYDPVRHQWRYDLGGFAWQNTELVPNIWLWYAFLRSGRADIFKMAEAMTRHTSEVDQYHLGEHAGLGSRHNVMHWGCGCKEARISMAGLHKYYYFLTGDERMGDLLTAVRDADYATVDLDPMREFYPKDEFPTHTRVGPDWAAFCSNWLTEWERTENITYKKKIIKGINNLKELPNRLLSGPVFGYDPQTSHLYHMGDGTPGGYHMVIAFGAPQVWLEIAQLLEDEDWKDMLAEFGEFYSLDDQEKRDRSENILNNNLFHWPMFAAGMTAYAAARNQDEKLAQKAWQLLLDKQFSHTPLPIEDKEIESFLKLKEISWATTNTISQWCLNTIVVLELIDNMLPDQALQESVNRQKSI